MNKAICALAAVALAGGVAGSADAAVTVIGGGLAEVCSKAAITGETETRFEDICTMAIESEYLNARDRAGTYVNRGVLRLRRAAYKVAERDFDMAIKARPDLGEAYVNRGAAYIGQKRYADSVPQINRGLELGLEEPAKAYYNRAIAYEGMDDPKAAYFDYKKALEIMPDWKAPQEQLVRFTVTTR
jgi:tetratricopeptide (TPR) repeat protein